MNVCPLQNCRRHAAPFLASTKGLRNEEHGNDVESQYNRDIGAHAMIAPPVESTMNRSIELPSIREAAQNGAVPEELPQCSSNATHGRGEDEESQLEYSGANEGKESDTRPEEVKA